MSDDRPLSPTERRPGTRFDIVEFCLRCLFVLDLVYNLAVSEKPDPFTTVCQLYPVRDAGDCLICQ